MTCAHAPIRVLARVSWSDSGAVISQLVGIVHHNNWCHYRYLFKTREIATGLGLAVGVLAEMFYDAVPKFSYAFISRITMTLYSLTLLTTRMPDSARAEQQQLQIPARGALPFSPHGRCLARVPYHRSRLFGL